MNHIDTVVIGAGHSGLAVSHLLTRADREHVVLERGRVGERWRSERWDSLRLLTPRWLSRLPGWSYTGPNEGGFMPAAEFVGHLERYAATSHAPVSLGEEVRELAAARGGYRIATSSTWWHARQVVIATGATGRPARPAGIDRLDDHLCVLSSSQYHNPSQLPPGGVLVVGASASGAQIADELIRAGRRVVLAVGRHTRMPRRYRARDIFWWLELTGRLARTRDITINRAAVHEPSLQLAGRAFGDPRGTEIDLGTLQRAGVELAGRPSGSGATTSSSRAISRTRSVTRTTGWNDCSTGSMRTPQQAGLAPNLAPARIACRCPPGRRAGSTCRRATSAPCCWLRGFVPITHGCGSRSPTRTGPSGRFAAPRRRRDCSSWGSGGSTGGTRPYRRCAPRCVRCRPPDVFRRRDAAVAAGGVMKSVDVAVVGGRVAGAATAMLLARAGLRVALLERGRSEATRCPPTA